RKSCQAFPAWSRAMARRRFPRSGSERYVRTAPVAKAVVASFILFIGILQQECDHTGQYSALHAVDQFTPEASCRQKNGGGNFFNSNPVRISAYWPRPAEARLDRGMPIATAPRGCKRESKADQRGFQ